MAVPITESQACFAFTLSRPFSKRLVWMKSLRTSPRLVFSAFLFAIFEKSLKVYGFKSLGFWRSFVASVFRLPSSILRLPSYVLRLTSSVFHLPSSVFRHPSSVIKHHFSKSNFLNFEYV